MKDHEVIMMKLLQIIIIHIMVGRYREYMHKSNHVCMYMYSRYHPHRCIIISLLQLCGRIKYMANYAIGYYTFDKVVTMARL